MQLSAFNQAIKSAVLEDANKKDVKVSKNKYGLLPVLDQFNATSKNELKKIMTDNGNSYGNLLNQLRNDIKNKIKSAVLRRIHNSEDTKHLGMNTIFVKYSSLRYQ